MYWIVIDDVFELDLRGLRDLVGLADYFTTFLYQHLKNQMKTELTYPTLDLYLYVLREGLGQSPAEVNLNRENFKRLLPLATIDGQKFDQMDEEGKYPEFEELLEGQSKTRTISWWPSSRKLDLESEWYYPVRMEDSYGVLFDCTLKYPQSAEDLTWLQSWKGPFEEKLKLFKNEVATEVQLGHTWMFSAVVPKSLSDPEKENLAQKCYETLVPDAVWKKDLVGTGSFLDGTVFELRVRNQEHWLLIFYSEEETAKTTVADFYQDWLPLFLYRHKVLWAYQNSRHLRKKLETLVVEMNRCRTEILQYTMPHWDAEKLEEALGPAEVISYQYTMQLGRLKVQSHTIDVNLDNYQTHLSNMEAKKSGIKLDGLRKFVQTGQQKYKQVQKDLAGFRPSLQVWDSLISFLRMRVEVETERREHHFQHTVSIFGVALAAGAIMASISGQFPTATPATFNETAINNHWLGGRLMTLLSWISSGLILSEAWRYSGMSILISFGVALLAGGLTAGLLKLCKWKWKWLWEWPWKWLKKSGTWLRTQKW